VDNALDAKDEIDEQFLGEITILGAARSFQGVKPAMPGPNGLPLSGRASQRLLQRRLCAAFQFSWIQLPGTVVHSHNVNITRSESINESITAKKNLSKVRIVHLWNNSA
jgi:hypothetical protein